MYFLFSAVAASSEETLRDALALQELMTSSVVDMRGENVTPDYSRGVAHVRMTLDELRERKLRTDELCDVRRIKLQQLLQLRQSERDAEQVINHHKMLVLLVVMANLKSASLISIHTVLLISLPIQTIEYSVELFSIDVTLARRLCNK